MMINDFFHKEWCYSDKWLVTLSALLFGMVWGFMIAPIKKGIYCGNYSGNVELPKQNEEE